MHIEVTGTALGNVSSPSTCEFQGGLDSSTHKTLNHLGGPEAVIFKRGVSLNNQDSFHTEDHSFLCCFATHSCSAAGLVAGVRLSLEMDFRRKIARREGSPAGFNLRHRSSAEGLALI